MCQGTPMSQRTVPSLHEHDGMVVSPPLDAPEIRREPPTPESAIAPATPPVDRSRLGVVLALVGAALLMQGAADALARAGHESPALTALLLRSFAPLCRVRMAPYEHACRTKRAGLGLTHSRSRALRLLRHAPAAPVRQLRRADPRGNPRTTTRQPYPVPDQFDPAGKPLLPRARTGHRRHEMAHRSPIGGR